MELCTGHSSHFSPLFARTIRHIVFLAVVAQATLSAQYGTLEHTENSLHSEKSRQKSQRCDAPASCFGCSLPIIARIKRCSQALRSYLLGKFLLALHSGDRVGWHCWKTRCVSISDPCPFPISLAQLPRPSRLTPTCNQPPKSYSQDECTL